MSVALQNQTGQSANYNTSDPPVFPAQNSMAKSSKWSQGVYFTPEYMLTNFDSVELLPAYSLNYEPTYHISNHFYFVIFDHFHTSLFFLLPSHRLQL